MRHGKKVFARFDTDTLIKATRRNQLSESSPLERNWRVNMASKSNSCVPTAYPKHTSIRSGEKNVDAPVAAVLIPGFPSFQNFYMGNE